MPFGAVNCPWTTSSTDGVSSAGSLVGLRSIKSSLDVADTTTGFYYESLWGKRGWREIQECLGAILLIVADIKTNINGIVGSVIKRNSRRSDYCDHEFDKQLFKNAIRRIERRTHRRIRFIWAVTLRADELDHDVERLEKYLIHLERYAEKLIFASRPSLRGLDPKGVQLKAQRVIQEKDLGVARAAVAQAREDARSLHTTYASNDSLACHLGIPEAERKFIYDLRPNPDFYFLLSDGFETVEVKIYPARFRASPARLAQLSANMTDGFKVLAQNASQKDSSTELLPPGARNGSGFLMCLAQRPQLRSLLNQPTLSALLQLNFNNRETLSRNSKAQVATSLIEGSYRLLNTPWLNTLDSTNIRGDKPPGAPT